MLESPCYCTIFHPVFLCLIFSRNENLFGNIDVYLSACECACACTSNLCSKKLPHDKGKTFIGCCFLSIFLSCLQVERFGIFHSDDKCQVVLFPITLHNKLHVATQHLLCCASKNMSETYMHQKVEVLKEELCTITYIW